MTPRQRDTLYFIARYQAEHGGGAPCFVEIKDALGLRSISGIHRLISGLEERGFIRRLAHRARSIEIVRRPEALKHHHVCPLCGTQLPQREAA